jgi:hypothetical protein
MSYSSKNKLYSLLHFKLESAKMNKTIRFFVTTFLAIIFTCTLSFLPEKGIAEAAQPPDRITGHWFGSYQCKKLTRRDDDSNYYIWLEINNETSGLTATAQYLRENTDHGTPKYTLAGKPTSTSDSFRIEPSSWRGYPRDKFGLEGRYLSQHDALYGKVFFFDPGRKHPKQCTFLVMRDNRPKVPENQGGLLFKVPDPPSRISSITLQDCVGYGEWLASGTLLNLPGIRAKVNSALTDLDGMRRILGRDIFQWSEEDLKKLKKIARFCNLKIVQKSRDNPALKQLSNRLRKNGGLFPAILQYPRDVMPRLQLPFKILLKGKKPLERLRLIKASLDKVDFEQSPTGMLRATRDVPSSGIAGIWVGQYTCQNFQYFLRLVLKLEGGGLKGVFEFGPSLTSASLRGALEMEGSFNGKDGSFQLKPKNWVYRPQGGLPMGFQGRLDKKEDTVEGQVLGSNKCESFHARRLVMPNKPVNKNGLLFKVKESDRINTTALTLSDCLPYAKWLASDEEILLGKRYLMSNLRDLDRMREVLGKDMYQWEDKDSRKMHIIKIMCPRIMKNSFDLEVLKLAEGIKIWAPNPLTVPKNEWKSNSWVMVEQQIYANEDAVKLAKRQFQEIEGLTPQLASLDSVDEGIMRIGKRKGQFKYLDKGEKEQNIADLKSSRLRLGSRIADSFIQEFNGLPPSFDGLNKLEAFHDNQKKKLLNKKAEPAAVKFSAAFHGEAAKRANGLLPGMLEEKLTALSGLTQVEYDRIDDFQAIRDDIRYLLRYGNPSEDAKTSKLYQGYKLSYGKNYEAMIERSMDDLIHWVNSLPPSKSALKAMDWFSSKTFEGAIPVKYAALRSAIYEKQNSYNPERYIQPEIIMSLRRGHWHEVNIRGLDSLAYFATTAQQLKKYCPGTFPRDNDYRRRNLMSFVLSAAKNAQERIMSGQGTKADAERGVWLMLNTIFNQPGCRIDFYGNISRCVSQEENQAVTQLLMTSGNAISDVGKFIGKHSCNTEPAKIYIENIFKFVSMNSFNRSRPPADFIPSIKSSKKNR